MTTYPYIFYACPCSEPDDTGLEEEERSFNPHDPRSAYSLNALDYLLYCDECNQIKCTRCVSDEILNWYCPSCLFEVPSSGVRGDGNRCSRNCYNCPICTSPVVVTTIDSKQDDLLKPGGQSGDEEYILACQYCEWTTLEVGVKLSRPNKITEQLNKARIGTVPQDEEEESGKEQDAIPLSADKRFEKMLSFYKDQLVESGDTSSANQNGGYGSPANLARIINLYGGLSHAALKKSQQKHQPMREATQEEGLLTQDSFKDENDIIQKMSTMRWDGTASQTQQMSAPQNFDARFTDQLWPVATHLRTKRGKRCRQCRQFVVRPETKVTGTKYRIRILAMNNIPRLSLKPLHSKEKLPSPSFILRLNQKPPETVLQPGDAKQYVLTLRNPIFEIVKVTLATPSVTPGKIGSRVTILCPSFSIGPAGDVWDEALSSSTMAVGTDGRSAAMASLTANADTERQPEAGKIWEQTRNSTSVILEIAPGTARVPITASGQDDDAGLEDGDDILEIPIYVRVEWTAEAQTDSEHKAKGEKEPRELAYWCVVGVGKIAT